MDRRTIVALALALFIFISFSSLQSKYAPKPVRKPVAGSLQPAVPGTLPAADTSAGARDGAVRAGAPGAAASAVAVAEKHIAIETPLYHAEFTNRGARMVAFELKRYAAAHGASDYAGHSERRPKRGEEIPVGDRVTLSGEPTFALDLGSGAARRSLENLVYEVTDSTDATGAVRALTFTGHDSSGALVRQTWRVRPDSYLIDLEVEMAGVPSAWRLNDYSLSLRSWPLINESSPQTDLRGLRAVSLVGKDLHRDSAPGLVGKEPKLHEGVAHWAGVQSHYFLSLVAVTGGEGRAAISGAAQRTLSADQLSHLPAGTKSEEPVATGTLVMSLPPGGSVTQRFVTYLGPADHALLAHESGPLELERAVDLGWSWIVPVSKLLLWLLKSINSVVNNYGITIFLLAFIIRLALHPLNITSMKSMRSMQRLQPEIERVREKYKNDTQAMNTAIMALYKENNVNPASGCVPMFMQMPLFFALYATINSAIDLRQAPFFGWIHDLSAPEVLFSVAGFPVRLLPLLMAGTGFLSQLFAPTDPRQAPTMYMMNLVMLGIFYNLPSGLVFYWTVMNLLTALQQWLAMRGDGGSGAVVVSTPAVAAKGRRG